MIHTNQWTPDSCDQPPCTIEYTWDDSVPAEERVHTPTNVVAQCDAHQGLDLLTMHSTLVSENTTKNIVLTQIQSIMPDLFDTNNTFAGTWSYDDSRVLNIQTAPQLQLSKSSQVSQVNVDQSSVDQIQTWCDQTFGEGKVVIS